MNNTNKITKSFVLMHIYLITMIASALLFLVTRQTYAMIITVEPDDFPRFHDLTNVDSYVTFSVAKTTGEPTSTNLNKVVVIDGTAPFKIDFKLTVPSPKHGAEVTKGLLPETEIAFERAKSLVERGEKRFVLLDFYAAWCSDSRLMDSLFSNPQIRDIVREKFAYVKVDVGNEYFNQNRSLITKYDIKAVPTLVVLDSHGNVIDKKLCDKTKGFLDEKDVFDSYGNVIDKEVLEPVTEPARTSGTMDMEKLRKYLLSL